jgi:hypothetical protein
VSTVVWTFVVGLKLDQPEHPTVALSTAFTSLPVILRQSIGEMGTYFLPLPFLVYALWVVLAVAGIVLAVVATTNRRRLAIALVALASLTLPLTTDAYNVPNIGFPWQGRYGLPVTVGLVILTCWLIDVTTPRRRLAGAAMVALVGVGHVAAFVAIARRFGMSRVEGLNIVDWLTRPRWEPGLPPGLLLALFVVGAVGLTVICAASLLAPAPPEDVTSVAAGAGTPGTATGHG